MGVQLDKVSFRYSTREPPVLTDISENIHAGDVVELVGRNGAGKSTLLKLLAGVVTPSSGSIHRSTRIIGFAPEVFPCGQPFRVAEYLAHIARLYGISAKQADKAISYWALRLGCDNILDSGLRSVSKGSAQKVGIIQALLPNPDLLVLDEPFANLDTPARQAVGTIVDEVAERGGTIFISDHEAYLQASYSRRWSIQEGTLETGVSCSTDLDRDAQVVVLEIFLTGYREAHLLGERMEANGYPVNIRPARSSGSAEEY